MYGNKVGMNSVTMNTLHIAHFSKLNFNIRTINVGPGMIVSESCSVLCMLLSSICRELVKRSK